MRQSAHKDILKFLQEVIPGGSQGQLSRRICLMACLIQACVRNGHCSLERLSEGTEAYRAQKKSSLLQQAKRWLNNKWTDWQSFYLPFARHFLLSLAAKGELVFIIDGSQTGRANTTLMLSVLCRGFAIPVAWVVKKGEKGHFPQGMHLDLLQMIAPICPSCCRVVLLGDGEFDGQALRRWCIDNLWIFVVRTSSDRQIDFNGEVARFDSIKPPIPFVSSRMPYRWQTGCSGTERDTENPCSCSQTWNWDTKPVIITNAGSRSKPCLNISSPLDFT